jgi:hypothetical protein
VSPLRETSFQTAAASEDDPWLIEIGLDAILTSNAAGTPDDEIALGIASPSASITYTHPQALFGWSLSAGADVSTDRYSRLDDDFNESAAGLRANARRDFAQNWVDLSVISTNRFDEDFSDRSASLTDYGVELGRNFSDAWKGSVRAGYRASDDDGAKRTTLRGALAYAFAQKPLGADWSVEQRVQYAAYRDGRNDGRDDVFARTQITGRWPLANGFIAALAARYAHTFSNRDAVESDVVEIAPSIGWGAAF